MGSRFRVDFEGDVYELEDGLAVAPGGLYTVEWERKGLTDEYDIEYSLRNTGGFEVSLGVRYDHQEVLNPDVDGYEVSSNREGWSEAPLDVFKDLWNDVRNGDRV